jgi:hypothetical protein
MKNAPIVLAFATLGFALAACGDDSGSTSGTGGAGAGTSQGGGGPSTSTTAGDGGGSTTSSMSTMSTSSGVPECMAETHAVMGACDLYKQDCPSDQSCVIVQNAMDMLEAACIPANGLKGVGEACMSADECQRGLQCVGDLCTPVCCEDNDEPCMGGSCNISVNDPDFGFLFKACSYAQSCTLFDPTSCPDGQNCYFESSGFATCSQQASSGKMDGEACIYRNDCDSSAICFNPADPSSDMGRICRYFCNEGDTTSAPGLGGCPMGQTCQTDVNFGFDGVGYCN